MISIVMTNYNGVHILEKCLRKNMACFEKAGIDEVIVVDDASQDDSVSFLETHFPTVTLIQHPYNKGIGASSNTGAQHASYPYVFFLNNDMVLQSIDVPGIIAYFSDTSCFGCSPKILRAFNDTVINESPNRGFFKGGWFTSENNPTQFDSVSNPERQPLLWGCGGAFLVDKSKFFDIGQFDDAFYSPSYGDDLDLSYRAWKRGWSVLYSEKFTCFHMHQSTIKTVFTPKHIHTVHLTNHYIFMWKNLTDVLFLLSHLMTVFIKVLTLQVTDIKAILGALMKVKHIFVFRKECPPSKRTDREVLSLF